MCGKSTGTSQTQAPNSSVSDETTAYASTCTSKTIFSSDSPTRSLGIQNSLNGATKNNSPIATDPRSWFLQLSNGEERASSMGIMDVDFIEMFLRLGTNAMETSLEGTFSVLTVPSVDVYDIFVMTAIILVFARKPPRSNVSNVISRTLRERAGGGRVLGFEPVWWPVCFVCVWWLLTVR